MRIVLLAGLILLASCRSEEKDKGGFEITNLSIDEIVGNRAVFNFTTSVETTCAALYGTDRDNLDLRATDPDMNEGEFSLTHSIPLEDLAPLTTYFVQAEATTRDGGIGYSVISEFITQQQGETLGRDNIAPLDAITITQVSSNFQLGANDDPSWGVNNAFDGLEGTAWASNGDGNDAFVEFNLNEGPTEIGGFGYRSRTMSDGTSVVTKVKLFFDDFEYTTVDIPGVDQIYEFNFDSSPITATKVRVEIEESSGGNTGAVEIRFYPPSS